MKSTVRLFSSAAICPINHPTTSSETVRTVWDIPGQSKRSLINTYRFSRKEHVSSYFDNLLTLYENYGPIVREDLGFGKKHVVHVFEPQDAQTVFRSDGTQPHIVPLQETTQKYREMRGMNPGLGNLNGEEWYRLRSATSQTLMKPQGMEKYVPFVEQVASRLVEHIKEERDKHGEADLKRIAGRWALESAGLIVFERRLEALGQNVDWADYLVDLNQEIFRLSADLKFALPIYKYVTTPKWKRMVDLEDKFYSEANILMDRAISELRNSGETIEAKEKNMLIGELANHPLLTVRDIKVIMLSLFSDGLSTTAPMLVYNIYNLAQNQEVQERLRKEVNNTVNQGKDLTSAKRNRMPLLRACIKETFRMFPIGTEISRIPQKDIVVGGYHIPAGTPIDINTNILTRSPSLFPDPLSFHPDRWLREKKNENGVHPFALLPFGIGPRMCAGRRFAEQDLQVVISRLVQNFRISHRGEEIKQNYETLLLPKGNCRFNFEPIN